MSELERYVASPVALRRRQRRWGADIVDVDLPGGPYRIEGLSSEQRRVLVSKLGLRCRPPHHGQTPVLLELRRAEAGDFRELDRRGWTWNAALERDGGRLDIASLGLLSRLRIEDGGWRVRLWTSRAGGEAFHGVLENCLRFVMAYRLLLAEEGLLLHSAGVVAENGAHLFLGRSGAGKSTLSTISLDAGLSVLSDDLNAVVFRDGVPQAERFPFAGDLRDRLVDARERFPVSGLWILEQGERHRVETASVARLVAAVVACAPFVNSSVEDSDLLLRRAERLVAAVSHGTLAFRRDPSFWSLLTEGSGVAGGVG